MKYDLTGVSVPKKAPATFTASVISLLRPGLSRKALQQIFYRPIRKGIFLLPVLLISSLPQHTSAQEIIVNSSLSSEGIRMNALRAIFSMRLRSWPDGTPVQVFVMDDEARLHVSFTKKKLDVFPHQLRYFWDRLVYSGTGQAPTKVDSEKEMLKMVAATPGAIGYLPEALVDDSVQVLNIQSQ